MTSLDEVREVQGGRSAVAVRHVPQTLDVFATHFPRFPVLPGVLVLDDLVEVARLAAGGEHAVGGAAGDGGHDGPPTDAAPWVLASVHKVRFRHFVQPGDSLEMTADVLDHDKHRDHDEDGGRGAVSVRGVARVDGRPVATVGRLVLRRVAKDET